ncbi:MAG: FAD-dependent oxidoreductase [Puniceicoccales bacterium]|jgi:thioredoxin reductase (NADPH)|nr:FAD-dependent oxidoreductase [Puniceicoccales bacterium]
MGNVVERRTIVVGSGCAGLTAALYLARAGLGPLVIDGDRPGGQLTQTSAVENYPGFPDGIGGYELVDRMRRQAERFGAEFAGDQIEMLSLQGKQKILQGKEKPYQCQALVIATGSAPVPLNVPGEKEYASGGGVSFCATCDGPFYRGKIVAVVGGGDSAAEEALFLAQFCEKVYLVHRRDRLRASKIMAERVLACKRIELLWNRVVLSAEGDGKRMNAVMLKDAGTGQISHLSCAALFISVGHRPNSAFAAGVLGLDENGYFRSGCADPVSSAVPGIFLAGDCSDPLYRQAIVAAGTGARAAIAAERWLLSQ